MGLYGKGIHTYKQYVKHFRGQSTAKITQGYDNYNAEFRKIARDELEKRRVPQKALPYKKRKVVRRGYAGIVLPRW